LQDLGKKKSSSVLTRRLENIRKGNGRERNKLWAGNGLAAKQKALGLTAPPPKTLKEKKNEKRMRRRDSRSWAKTRRNGEKKKTQAGKGNSEATTSRTAKKKAST